jgi:hypothetical protein
MGKKSRSGSGMELRNNFLGIKFLNSLCGSGIRELFDPGSGMGKKSDPG